MEIKFTTTGSFRINACTFRLFFWGRGGASYFTLMDLVATPYPCINVPNVKTNQSLFILYTNGSMNLQLRHQTPRTS